MVNGLDVSIRSTDLVRAAAAMDRVGRSLTQELEDALQRNALVMAASARAAVQSIPSSGKYGTNVRAATAGAIKTRNDQTGSITSLGKIARATIYVDDAMLPPEHKKVPELWDRRGGWRHPVYGSDTWVSQKGRQWFRLRMARHRRIVQASLEQVMRAAVKYVDSKS